MTKTALHPRNQHQVVAGKAYDLDHLVQVNPDLKKWLTPRPDGEMTVNFSEPDAVKQLNKALLLGYYGIDFWDIPEQFFMSSSTGQS